MKKGDRVRCILSSSLMEREIRFVGLLGTVLMVDDGGSAFVQFDGIEQAVWINRAASCLQVAR